MMGGDPVLSGFEDQEQFGFETRAIRAGQPHDERTGGVVTPIALSTTLPKMLPGLLSMGMNIHGPEIQPVTHMKRA